MVANDRGLLTGGDVFESVVSDVTWEMSSVTGWLGQFVQTLQANRHMYTSQCRSAVEANPVLQLQSMVSVLMHQSHILRELCLGNVTVKAHYRTVNREYSNLWLTGCAILLPVEILSFIASGKTNLRVVALQPVWLSAIQEFDS